MRKVIFPRQTGNVAPLTGNAYCCSTATHKKRPSHRVCEEREFLIQSSPSLLNHRNETTQVEFYAFRYFRCVDVSLVARRSSRARRIMWKCSCLTRLTSFCASYAIALNFARLEPVLASGQREILGDEYLPSNTYRIVHAVTYKEAKKFCVEIAKSYENYIWIHE